jgi:arginyl-tRNA synthetase
MHDPESVLVERLRDAMGAALGGDCAEVDPLIRPAQDRKFGDFQANVAMSLGKRLGRNPRELAAAIVQQLQWAGLCAEAPVVAGPGFINLRLSEEFLSQVATSLAAHAGLGVQRAAPPQTIVVDYSSPNVAKEMHVGHLRSTVIGDALARTLEFLGHKVVRQNHLGDWGTQFGMLIQHAVEQQVALNGRQWVGFGELTDFYRQAKQRFDEDVAFAERARQRVVALQSGDAQTLELWRFLVTVSAGHFCRIYQQLGVSLAEADIRGESFYNPRLVEVVHALRDKGLAVLSKGAWCVFVEGFDDPLMVQKSDGGFGYAATDLAAIRYRVQSMRGRRTTSRKCSTSPGRPGGWAPATVPSM